MNVTAGLDLAIGEFEEVGRIVKEFASEDATVVVGTVIDPEMSNEIRVTVVATGLNRNVIRQQVPVVTPVQAREAMRTAAATAAAAAPPASGRTRTGAAPNYQEYERPTIVRKTAVGDGLSSAPLPAEELLDIPAFLRRQAD